MQPVDEVVVVDSVTSHPVVDGVHLIRGNCKSRLKYEIEYNLKRGTTDNSYVIKVDSVPDSMINPCLLGSSALPSHPY